MAERKEDTEAHCVYAFGTPSQTVGRVRLQKASGDVEVLDGPGESDGFGPSFYLAHLVPRLHAYHDRGAYPKTDRWTV